MPPKKKADKTEKVERYGTKISGDGPVKKTDTTADTKTPEQVEPKAEKKDA